MLQLRLKQGDDFSALAQNYSEDAGSAPNGGDLGSVPESALERVNPDLRKAIMDMPPGQVSPILRTPEGYRLIKVLGKTMAGQRVLSDPRVQEEIRTRLFNSKDQVLRAAFVEVARDEAKVRNYYAESVLESRDKK
jgi:peptidyl-prolyl cis-trans isomerase SurA